MRFHVESLLGEIVEDLVERHTSPVPTPLAGIRRRAWSIRTCRIARAATWSKWLRSSIRSNSFARHRRIEDSMKQGCRLKSVVVLFYPHGVGGQSGELGRGIVSKSCSGASTLPARISLKSVVTSFLGIAPIRQHPAGKVEAAYATGVRDHFRSFCSFDIKAAEPISCRAWVRSQRLRFPQRASEFR